MTTVGNSANRARELYDDDDDDGKVAGQQQMRAVEGSLV